MGCDENDSSPLRSSCQKHVTPGLPGGKTSDKCPLTGIQKDSCSDLFKTVKVIKSKESLRNHPSAKCSLKGLWLKLMWYLEWDLGIEKGH